MADEENKRRRSVQDAPKERLKRMRADIGRAAEAMEDAHKARSEAAAAKSDDSLVRSMIGAIERGEGPRAPTRKQPRPSKPADQTQPTPRRDSPLERVREARREADPEIRESVALARSFEAPREEAAPIRDEATERSRRVRALRKQVTGEAERAAPPPPRNPQPEPPSIYAEPAEPRGDPLRVARTRSFAGFEWSIAARYLRARRKEGFISVIAGLSLAGIAIGVAALIIVMAVMTGFREKLIEQILGVNAHVNVVSQTEKFEDYDSLANAIRAVEGVTRASPLVEGQVLATSDQGHSGVVVRGMRRADLQELKVVSDPERFEGSLEGFSGDNGVAVGSRLAAKLGLRLGDSITLITPDGDITPFGTMPRSKSYPILYVFQIGLHEYDSVFVYMPLEEAQIYFNKKGRVDSLEVMVEDPNNVEQYTGDVRNAARQSIGLHTWKDLNGSFIGALDVERNVMFIILALIILVAALNIISGLIMLVKDKARDVAIMRTMGMGRGSVLRIFFICGAAIGVIGAVAGVIIGVLFCTYINELQTLVESVFGVSVFPADVYGLSGLPAKMLWSDVLFTLGLALGLSFFATLYPAWRAASLDPVEALRYE